MSTRALGLAALVLVVDAVWLLVMGEHMHSEGAQAEAAVGKGLAILGGAVALPAFVVLIAFLEALDRPGEQGEQAEPGEQEEQAEREERAEQAGPSEPAPPTS